MLCRYTVACPRASLLLALPVAVAVKEELTQPPSAADSFSCQAAGVSPADVEDIVINSQLQYLTVVLRRVRRFACVACCQC